MGSGLDDQFHPGGGHPGVATGRLREVMSMKTNQFLVLPLLRLFLLLMIVWTWIQGNSGWMNTASAMAAEGSPDLVVTSITASQQAHLRQTVSVTFTVKNRGDSDAGAYAVALYLSDDNQPDPEKDRLIKKQNFSKGLPAKQSRKTSSKVTIAKSILPGDYYLTAFVDSDNTIVESNEGNNFRVSPEKILILRYEDNNDTVTDLKTRLIWQKADDGQQRIWADAKQYCLNLELGGLTNWRFPRADELRTLVNYGLYNPAIDPVFANEPSPYWSTSNYAITSVQAWQVDFDGGRVDPVDRSEYAYVRCVYGGPYWALVPSKRLVILDDNTTRDTQTNLIWQRADDRQFGNLQDATEYCENLELNGQSDWRLPTISELQTIIDLTRSDPAFDTKIFVDNIYHYYWSSSGAAFDPDLGWYVHFGNGAVNTEPQTQRNAVRCVRGISWW